MHRQSTERGDRIQQQEAIVAAAEIADAFHRLAYAGGGFGMHERQDRRLVQLHGRFQLLQAEGFPQGRSIVTTSAR